MITSTHVRRLQTLVGANAMILDEDILKGYSSDWSAIADQIPLAVIKPSSSEQVSQVLKYCNEQGIKIVIQGGRTGLCGGATPKANEVALSLERMNHIVDIDEHAMTMTVEAGATLEQVQNKAKELGLQFPLDLSARGNCTIGGNAATNAGGNRVIKYGMMRDLVLGIEAVIPNGDIVGGMNTMMKNNAGFDLKHLFIGSEGTLGIITRLVLKLVPRADETMVMLCGAENLEKLTLLLAKFRHQASQTMSAFEVMWADYFDEVINTQKLARKPFSDNHAIYALVEFQGTDKSVLQTISETLLGEALEQDLIKDVILGQSLQDNIDIWGIREAIAELLSIVKPFIAFDISMPLGQMQHFVDTSKQLVADKYPQARYFAFGHLGDGNLHLTISYPQQDKLHAIEDDVLQIAGKIGASISGEHGIGVIKKDFLKYSRSDSEIALMKTLKEIIDPNHILNCGRVVDLH
ncbi:MAG: FAD-binding oxidoreductase [Paraglaciecola sp.]|uniref:FAD-binding oxidoreductase n=1 Tax=Paraglaciecola sp. TaxID=1920173 RepID=UPI00329A6E7D